MLKLWLGYLKKEDGVDTASFEFIIAKNFKEAKKIYARNISQIQFIFIKIHQIAILKSLSLREGLLTIDELIQLIYEKQIKTWTKKRKIIPIKTDGDIIKKIQIHINNKKYEISIYPIRIK